MTAQTAQGRVGIRIVRHGHKAQGQYPDQANRIASKVSAELQSTPSIMGVEFLKPQCDDLDTYFLKHINKCGFSCASSINKS